MQKSLGLSDILGIGVLLDNKLLSVVSHSINVSKEKICGIFILTYLIVYLYSSHGLSLLLALFIPLINLANENQYVYSEPLSVWFLIAIFHLIEQTCDLYIFEKEWKLLRLFVIVVIQNPLLGKSYAELIKIIYRST